jgi:maltose/moltooligosaccharide transporter
MQQAKPNLSFWQIWNMCFGFLGIQFGFALQNGNVSRIFQTLGASIDEIPILWIAGPLTGLLVQPIVGYFSDRTWNKLGRRRPYFFYGAVLTTVALFFMPNSPTLWMAAGMLWILDASINITMEPFRAFVGDNLNKQQRPLGFSMQSFFIGVGAVVASALPYILSNWFDVANTAPAGEIPDSVKYSFYAGGLVLLVAVLWTVMKSTEYSPEQLAAFGDELDTSATESHNDRRYWMSGAIFTFVGLAALLAVFANSLDQQLYVLGGCLLAFGLLQWLVSALKTSALKTSALKSSSQQTTANSDSNQPGMLVQIVDDLFTMPTTMRHLAVVQFFSWFALFSMWIYTTAAVTSVHYGSSDPTSSAYNDGADWVGLLFAFYNGFAAIAAVLIPWVVRKTSLQISHSINLICGAVGLMAFLWIKDPALLWIPMIGVGIAWASILSLPYALLADSLPSHKMGVYMGMFNFFIVLPQLLAASILGTMLNLFFNGEAIYALATGAVSLVIAAVYVLTIKNRSLSH